MFLQKWGTRTYCTYLHAPTHTLSLPLPLPLSLHPRHPASLLWRLLAVLLGCCIESLGGPGLFPCFNAPFVFVLPFWE